MHFRRFNRAATVSYESIIPNPKLKLLKKMREESAFVYRRAQRAKLKSHSDGMMVAQGKRGTSAALGYTAPGFFSLSPRGTSGERVGERGSLSQLSTPSRPHIWWNLTYRLTHSQ